MKKIQVFLLALITAAGTFTSCTDYQDEIDALDYRVTVLEELVKRINHDIEALQIVVEAMADGDYITNVTEYDDSYIITFNKAGAIVVKDGEKGNDGQDANVPNISVLPDEKGDYYWVLDGEWLLDEDGNKIYANGKDGKDGKDGLDGKDGVDGRDGKDGKDGVDGRDGKDGRDGLDGKDGKDGIAPQVRINDETGLWEISIDGGESWVSTSTYATGKDGKNGRDGRDGADGKDGRDGRDGADGRDGKDGKNGADGNNVFEEVRIVTHDDGLQYVEFKLKGSGIVFYVPLYTTE